MRIEKRLRSFPLFCLAHLLVGLLNTLAEAHQHPSAHAETSQSEQKGGVLPFHASFSGDYTEYQLGFASGHYVTWALGLSYQASEQTSLQARLPFHTLWKGAEAPVQDVGDPDLLILHRLSDRRASSGWYAGVEASLPYGNEALGLGMGHMMWSLFGTLATDLAGVPVHASLGDHFGIVPSEGGHSHHEDQAIIYRMSLHELHYGLGATQRIKEWEASLDLDFATVLTADHFGETFPQVGSRLGWELVKNWTLALAAILPFSGNRRMDWQSGLALDHRF